MAIGFLWVSRARVDTPYLEIVGQMLLLGVGLGLTTAPATESIMGSLPVDKAGVGSAVNDTTRETAGPPPLTPVTARPSPTLCTLACWRPSRR